jgi:diguanylate cyclase (GGDEF)-like protein
MVDVDNFKRYNDRHGHEAGNLALTEIAGLMTGSLRQADIAARYGGEEFVLILPATPKTDAYRVAERTRQAVEGHQFAKEKGVPGCKLTVSKGLATFPADGANVGELIRSADHALYSAKASGKNHVTLFGRSQRSFERVEASIAGSYRVLAPESIALSTINVSEAGVMFRTEEEVPVGTVIQVELSLPDPYGNVKLSGHVVHAETKRPGTHQTAVKITSSSRDDRSRLLRYLREMDVYGRSEKAG